MKIKRNAKSLGRLAAAFSASLVITTLPAGVYAADRVWTAGGDQSSWSDPNNWDGLAPVANDSLFFGNSAGLNNNNDAAANTAFSGITFNSEAGAFTLSGNAVNLSGGVTNNSTSLQSINLTLGLNGGDRDFVTAVGDLICYQVNGSSGLPKIVKSGAGTLTLSGPNDNSYGAAVVNEGVLVLDKTSNGSVHALGGDTTVNTNGILRVAGTGGDQIFYRANIILNGGVLQMQAANTDEEIQMFRGLNPSSVVENGLGGTTNKIRVGGNRNNHAIYSGIIRDGAAGVLDFEVRLRNNIMVLNGTNSYSGVTTVNNNDGSPAARLIVNGVHTGGGSYEIVGGSSDSTRQAALGGSGIISAGMVNINANGILSPGGALSDESNTSAFSDTTAILTVSNAVNLTSASSTLELQLNGTAAGTGYDQVNIAGSGVLSNNSANLKLTLGFTPASGDKFTIVKVQGSDPASNAGVFASLNGVPTDLSQGATFVDPNTGQNFRISYNAEGDSFDAGDSGNDIMLEAVSAVGGQNLTWRGDGTLNNWDIGTTANWWNGSGLSAFANGDFVTFDSTGSNNIPVSLAGEVNPATLTIDSTNDYIVAGLGKLTGTIVVVKTNSGTFTLVTDNDYVGSTLIRQGTLQLGTNGTTGSITAPATISSNGVLAINRSDDITISSATFSGSGGLVHNGSGKLVIAADLHTTFTGNITNSGGTLQFGDGSGTVGSVGGNVELPAGKTAYYYSGGGTMSIYNSLSGDGTVEFDGGIGQTYEIGNSVVSSNFSGVINVQSGGRVHVLDHSYGYPLGNGSTVNVPAYSQVWLDRIDNSGTYNQVFNIAGTGYVGDINPYGALRVYSVPLTGEINLMDNARIGGSNQGATISAGIHGPYELDFYSGGPNYGMNLGPANGINDYASTRITLGYIQALNENAISSGPLTIDSAGQLRLNGHNLSVASLTSVDTQGGAGATVENGGAANAVLTVGADGSSSQFDGVFFDGGAGSLGLTKAGAGTLTLSRISTNTGPVTIEGGSILLNEPASFENASVLSLGASATLNVTGRADQTLNLHAGQSLKGDGTIQGNLIADSGSIINPGAAVGTLTVSGNITLNGQLTLELDRDASPTSDKLVSSGGTITYGGTLVITNSGAALQVNDTFQLFPSGVTGFASVTLVTVDANNQVYTWQNNIDTLGSIKVVSVGSPVNDTPTNITTSVSGGTLDLTWPEDHVGWRLQTNSVSLTDEDAWFDYPGSTSTNHVAISIDHTRTNVFFRLVYP